MTQIQKILIIVTSVLAVTAAILGVTVFTASTSVETEDVISNAIFAISNEVDGAYTAAALEKEFALGKQLCTSFCVAGVMEQDATQQATINGIVGATCTCDAACLCSGYEENFKTYLAGGTSELAAMGGLSSSLSKLTWSKVYDISIGATGMTKKISVKLGDAPDINPRLTDVAILGAEAGEAAPAYGGFAAILTAQWTTLKATFEPAVEQFDMASLTPDDAVLHQKYTGDNSFKSDEYKTLMDEEFATKVAFAMTAPLGATGANADFPKNEVEYKEDWYARLAYGESSCPKQDETYQKREYAIVDGAPIVTDYNPSDRIYGGVSEHESNYSHCDACESAPNLIKTMALLGVLSAFALCAMSLARLKLGGNAIRFASVIFGLFGVVFFAWCTYAMTPCANAINDGINLYKDYNVAIGLLVPQSFKSTATTKFGSPFISAVACTMILLVGTLVAGIAKIANSVTGVTPATPKDSPV